MAGSSLLVLIDDIATVLDDVALMTKAATKKTAGVLGDDLALNAQQVTGVKPARELPVVLAVARGSMINKAILVPAALAISFFMPWLVTPLLMLLQSLVLQHSHLVQTLMVDLQLLVHKLLIWVVIR